MNTRTAQTSYFLNISLLIVGILIVVTVVALGVVSLRVKTESLAREIRVQEQQLQIEERKLRLLEGQLADLQQPENLVMLAQAHGLELDRPDPAAVVRLRNFPETDERALARSEEPRRADYEPVPAVYREALPR
ncbi:MAG: hypothetical protein ACOCVG_02845 [Verrucomicrobiota bacterium]